MPVMPAERPKLSSLRYSPRGRATVHSHARHDPSQETHHTSPRGNLMSPPEPTFPGTSSGRRRLRLRDLEVVKTLGVGSFARVLLVRIKEPKLNTISVQYGPSTLMALKVIKKTVLRKELDEEKTHAERACLSRLPWNPFITGLVGVFSDRINVYEMLELASCGNLRSQISRAHKVKMEPEMYRFFFANIVLGLQFIHSHGFAHRDLKPENIVINENGYLCLTDFGLAAKSEKGGLMSSRVGTPWYMAPELVSGVQAIEVPFAEDWWAAGIILYELASSTVPFRVGDRRKPLDGKAVEDKNMPELFSLIKTAAVPWPGDVAWNAPLQNIIVSLLEKDPYKRLSGSKFNTALFTHPWLSSVDWKNMQRQLCDSPYVPPEPLLEDRWHGWPLPLPSEVPSLTIVEPPVELLHDGRFIPVIDS